VLAQLKKEQEELAEAQRDVADIEAQMELFDKDKSELFLRLARVDQSSQEGGDVLDSSPVEEGRQVEINTSLLALLQSSAKEIPATIKTDTVFNQHKIIYVGQLVQRTKEQMLSIRGFGPTCLSAVLEGLAEHNLRLGMTAETPEIAMFNQWLAERAGS
jgi:DNA-directed RNA polymerase alpha subunit